MILVNSSLYSLFKCVQLLQAALHCFSQGSVRQRTQIGAHKAALGATAGGEQLDTNLAIG
jgi:hypothetical protein